jgi:hypothetical protein
MENRKKLHDYSLLLIFLGVLNLFMFGMTIVARVVDGSFSAAFAKVEPDILVATKVTVAVFGVLLLLLVVADALIGIKGLKVSANPTTDKGYITLAKVFFVLSALAAVFSVGSLFDRGTDIVENILTLANGVIDTIVYGYFVKTAQAVRADALSGVK